MAASPPHEQFSWSPPISTWWRYRWCNIYRHNLIIVFLFALGSLCTADLCKIISNNAACPLLEHLGNLHKSTPKNKVDDLNYFLTKFYNHHFGWHRCVKAGCIFLFGVFNFLESVHGVVGVRDPALVFLSPHFLLSEPTLFCSGLWCKCLIDALNWYTQRVVRWLISSNISSPHVPDFILDVIEQCYMGNPKESSAWFCDTSQINLIFQGIKTKKANIWRLS